MWILNDKNVFYLPWNHWSNMAGNLRWSLKMCFISLDHSLNKQTMLHMCNGKVTRSVTRVLCICNNNVTYMYPSSNASHHVHCVFMFICSYFLGSSCSHCVHTFVICDLTCTDIITRLTNIIYINSIGRNN